jgi:DNA polymerase III subunit delta
MQAIYFYNMSTEKILTDLKNRNYKPIYWLEGEESYFIDEIVQYCEHKILSESEAGFNLTIFYGKDADWAQVINACKRYPMFSEKQVVLLKEAQQMKELEKLESYIENPLNSTIFIVAHKEKKIDGRGKLAKLLKQKAEVFYSAKLKDYQIPEWASTIVSNAKLTITNKALQLMVDHIGSDLSRIKNEIEKLQINLKGRTSITEDDIEQFIGISKEFNVFELQNAIGKKDFAKAIRINQYFAANPKAAPIQLIIPSLYSFFSKVYMLFGLQQNDEQLAMKTLGVFSNFVLKEYTQAAKLYGQQGVENAILLLHEYNLKSIGFGGNTDGSELMKELLVKLMS